MTVSGSNVFIPVFCKGPVILRALVLAQAVAIVLAFAPGASSEPWLRLGFVSLFVQWITLTTSALLCVFRRQLNGLQPVKQGAAVISILLLVTLTVSISAYAVFADSVWGNPLPFTQFVVQNLLVSAIVGLMAIQFFMLHTERHQRLTAQARAELEALQARIQPHFLFNSLNTVAELTQQDAKAAEQALLDLAALFRAALHAGSESTLNAEIILAKQYSALEQWRLGERLTISWTIPQIVPEVPVPALLLQPLLENAIRHGIEPLPEGGEITIELNVCAEQVVVMIVNPVVASDSRNKGHGIALDNVRQRLELMYEGKGNLASARIGLQYRVKLVLPLA